MEKKKKGLIIGIIIALLIIAIAVVLVLVQNNSSSDEGGYSSTNKEEWRFRDLASASLDLKYDGNTYRIETKKDEEQYKVRNIKLDNKEVYTYSEDKQFAAMYQYGKYFLILTLNRNERDEILDSSFIIYTLDGKFVKEQQIEFEPHLLWNSNYLKDNKVYVIDARIEDGCITIRNNVYPDDTIAKATYYFRYDENKDEFVFERDDNTIRYVKDLKEGCN